MIAILLFLLALIAANALYVAAEFAAVSARLTRVREVAERGNRSARWVVSVLGTGPGLDRYVACSQVGITLSSLLLGAFGQARLAPPLADLLMDLTGSGRATSLGAAATITLLGLTAAQVIVGELVPKSLALQFPTQTVVYTAIPMRASLWALRPLIAFLNGSGTLILRALGAASEGHRHIHSPQEISLLVAESREGGLLSGAEHERLDRALRLSLLPVRRLMVPRTDIVSVEPDWSLLRVQEQLISCGFTRLPVFSGNPERIDGVVHAKEVARRLVAGDVDLQAREIMRPIATVPESMRAERLVAELSRQQSEQAIVVDEHGGVAGLVTLEDLLTEVLGDSPFTDGASSTPEELPDGRLRLPGRTRVDEAREWLGVLWEGESDTLGGMVQEELGHIPEPGERLVIGDVEVEVEAVDQFTVQSLLVKPVRPEGQEEVPR